jgi:hypothetical protein
MTDEERDSFDNLILMCPNHHQLVDDLEPENYSVEFLTDMKQRATVRPDAWRYDDEYLLIVSRLMETKLQYEQAAFDAQSSTTPAYLEGSVTAVSTVTGRLSAGLSSDRLMTNAEPSAIKDISGILLDMRNLFNMQYIEHKDDQPPWVPGYGTPETLARTNLIRRLEMSLAMLGFDADALPKTNTLMTTHLWSNTLLEEAIKEVKDVLGGSS